MPYSVSIKLVDASHDEILKYIQKYIRKNYSKGPCRSYMLQCAYWAPSEYHKDQWIAYSPVSLGKYSGYWPLESVDIEYADDESHIEFHSWKGHYDTQHYGDIYGNLPKKPNKLGTLKAPFGLVVNNFS